VARRWTRGPSSSASSRCTAPIKTERWTCSGRPSAAGCHQRWSGPEEEEEEEDDEDDDMLSVIMRAGRMVLVTLSMMLLTAATTLTVGWWTEGCGAL
jgi:hypothetical protein